MGKKDKLQQVSYLMEKLYQIDKELGGNQQSKEKAKGTEGEFENLFTDCSDRMMKVRGMQKNLDSRQNKQGRDKEVIVQEHQIRSELYDCQKLVEEMDRVLTKQAKKKETNKQELELRNKKYLNLKNILYRMMKDSGINPPEEPLSEADESKSAIPDSDKHKLNVLGVAGQRNPGQRYEADEKEQAALKKIDANNKVQDEIIDNIYELVGTLDNKVKNIGGKQDHIQGQIVKVTKKVDETNKILDTQNQRLKVLITKYRAPSKFCLDITLILFIVGLIGILWTMLK
ncbi:hypothetical protein ABPG74_021181 [Tetrahymena malaccensis]